jgi:hypothetical protein
MSGENARETHVFLGELYPLLAEHLQASIAVQVPTIVLGLFDIDVIRVLGVSLEAVVEVVGHVGESAVCSIKGVSCGEIC